MVKENDMKLFFGDIERLINKVVDERLQNVAFVKPATVVSVAANGLSASIRILGDNAVLTNVPCYNVRNITAGMPCHVVHWGGHNKLTSCALVFGGTSYR